MYPEGTSLSVLARKMLNLIPPWGYTILVTLAIISFVLLGFLVLSMLFTQAIYHKKRFPHFEKIIKITFIIFIIDVVGGGLFSFLLMLFKAVGFLKGIIILLFGGTAMVSAFKALLSFGEDKPFDKWKKLVIWALIFAISLFIIAITTGHHLIT